MTEQVASNKVRSVRRLWLVIAGVVLVITIVGGLYWLKEVQKKPSIEIGHGLSVEPTVSTLPPGDLEQVAAVYIVNPAWDMDWAYAKAVALSTQGKHKESLNVYRSITGTGKAKYYIYVDYALTARRAGDVQLAVDMMTKAISTLDGDTSVDQKGKVFVKKRLNSKLDGFKSEIK